MKYFHYLFIISVLTCTLFVNCAKRGNITGGPKDSLAPVLLKASPENFSTHFNSKEIKLTFDEYIKLDKINQQLIISPPMDNMPEITPMGFANKNITIRLLDTLKSNTTYSINFGQSIVDNNEGNPYPSLRYVFSTGDYIDSLKVTTKIKDAISNKNNSFTKILLFQAENFTDSTIYKQKPMYVANSLDSLQEVTVENVKEGDYYLFALYEKNNNYKFDPNTDKLAFLDKTINTLKDTVYELNLFKEKKRNNFGRPSMVSQNKWLIAAEGDLKNIKIEVSDFKNNLPTAFFQVEKKDSLHVFVPKTESDSLKFTLINGDLRKEQIIKTRNVKTIDSLQVKLSNSSTIDFTDSLRITATTPITKLQLDKIILTKKDSTLVEFQAQLDTLANQLNLSFDKEESNEYTVTLLPNAIEDVFGKTNDTLSYKLKTVEFSEYANLTIQVNHSSEFPMLLQLLDEKENLMMSQWITEERSVQFNRIKPNKYYIRVLIDKNKNGMWDTGNYLMKQQPEPVIHFPNYIDARANWEINETINIP